MSWVVQIYDMTDIGTQELVQGLLSGLDGTTAQTAANGPDHYVVVECGTARQAQAVFSLVTSADPGATLIHTTKGRAGNIPLEPDPDDKAADEPV
jgi:hypothetical protein